MLQSVLTFLVLVGSLSATSYFREQELERLEADIGLRHPAINPLSRDDARLTLPFVLEPL